MPMYIIELSNSVEPREPYLNTRRFCSFWFRALAGIIFRVTNIRNSNSSDLSETKIKLKKRQVRCV